jgi:hypothetical protein
LQAAAHLQAPIPDALRFSGLRSLAGLRIEGLRDTEHESENIGFTDELP